MSQEHPNVIYKNLGLIRNLSFIKIYLNDVFSPIKNAFFCFTLLYHLALASERRN